MCEREREKPMSYVLYSLRFVIPIIFRLNQYRMDFGIIERCGNHLSKQIFFFQGITKIYFTCCPLLLLVVIILHIAAAHLYPDAPETLTVRRRTDSISAFHPLRWK